MVEWFLDEKFIEVQIFLGLLKLILILKLIINYIVRILKQLFYIKILNISFNL